MSQLHEEQNFFQLTSEFVQHTSQHIFLTGKAGTGKTTFLKHIKEHCDKKLVVVAPTGVAAINAGGVTAHSFFQLPPGTFYPGSLRGQFHSETAVTDRHHLFRNFRLSNEKRDLMRNLELLIIDEVSMVRADMLDAIDAVLRFVRKNQREPFGGVQVLFIGDLFQLPPVVKENEWQLLREFYTTPFFFESLVYKQASPLCIELKKVYRQSDEDFIHLLNRIRNNEVEEDDLQQLQQLYKPNFRYTTDNHFITLTTHNYKADDINARELKRLSGKEFICEAIVQDEFPDRNFPVEKSMRLKPGAQIMFVRNDTEEKKYFNGKIGVLSAIDHDDDGEFITVEFPESKQKINVRKVTWQNIRYKFNEATNGIEEEELGSFTQYPIRLAWAVTIHKSQGLTFQRAVIDAGNAFAAGQVYVALSRCVSLDGIVLLSQIPRNVIITDPAIVEFMNYQNSIEALLPILEREKEVYVVRKTLLLFNMQALVEKMKEFMEYMGERKIEDKEKIFTGLHTINDSLLKMKEVAEKFQEQVKKITDQGFTETTQAQLNDRIIKAKAYFEKELDEKVNDALAKLNKELQQQNKVRKLLKEMKSFMNFFEGFTNRYRLEPKKLQEQFYRQVSSQEQANKISEESSQNLTSILKQIRSQFAIEENVPPFQICHDSTLKEIAMYLPQSMNDMAMIKGMGDYRLKNYGEQFLAAVQTFCAANSQYSQMHLKEEEMRQAKKKKNKSEGGLDTQTISLHLFESGKTVSEIAIIRNLAAGTIESHLAYFVRKGNVDVFKLLSQEKFELIKNALQKNTEPGLSPVKNILGDEVSYGEIRFVVAALDREHE